MGEDSSNMLTMDYMENDSIAFGLSTGTYHALFEEGVEDDALCFSKKAVNSVASADKGFLSDFGLADDGLTEKWSLLEQLQLEGTDGNLEINHVMNDSHSSRPSSVCDAFVTEDACILSPFSESSDSGVSSCHSPYGDCRVDELESSVWLQDHFIADSELPNEFEGLLGNVQVLSPGSKEVGFSCFNGGVQDLNQGQKSSEVVASASGNVDYDSGVEVKCSGSKKEEMVETDQVSFIENREMPPVIVEEGVSSITSFQSHPVPILPGAVSKPEGDQPIFILKTKPVVSKPAGGLFVLNEGVKQSTRCMPYPKGKPSKSKTPQQKEKKKHQNRNAASRYRNKKKDELNDLFEEAKSLEETNKGLSDKVTSLTKEIDYLKSLMLDVIKARLSRSISQDS